MKKLFSIFCAASMLLCSAAPVGAAFPDGITGIETVEALYFENAPAIDGIIDPDEWGEATTSATGDNCATASDVSPRYNSFYTSVSGSPQLQFDLWLRWDEDYYYVAAKVKDPDGHSMRNTGSNAWNGDAVQFRLDPKGSNASGSKSNPWSNSASVCDLVCGYYSTGKRVECFDGTNSVGLSMNYDTVFDPVELAVAPSDVSSSTHFSEDTANGYTSYEIAVPWKYVFENNLVPIYDSLTDEETLPICLERSQYSAANNPAGGVGREIGMSLMLLNAAQGSSSYNSLLSWGSGIAYVQKTTASATAAGSNAVTLSYTSVEDTLAGDLDIVLSSRRMGNKLYVDMDLANNPGIWSMKTVLDYNTEALHPVSYTVGDVFANDQLDHSTLTDENLLMIAYNEALDANNEKTGRVITYEFEILDSNLPYDFNLSVSQKDIFDCTLSYVAYTVVNTADTPESTYIEGDINLDGSVNVADVFYMKGVIVGSADITEDNLLAGDLNGDGRITISDIFNLKAVLIS